MIRLAGRTDLPQIVNIRDNAGEVPLSDPSAPNTADLRRFIDNTAVWVWQDADGLVTGFCGSDARDGSIFALLVAPGHEGKGIGRALLKTVCDALRDAGHREAWLTASPGTRAERHYRAAGWTDAGHTAKGELILRKSL